MNTQGKLFCFHHTDFDGKAAGACIYKWSSKTAVMRPIDYGFPFPWEDLTLADEVVMVDFSLQPFEDMVRLGQLVGKFTWIDHHASAIKEYEKWKDVAHIEGVQQVGPAGCELAWDWCNPSLPRPFAIQLLGRFDMYDLEFHHQVMPFQYGIRAIADTAPTAKIWNLLLDSSDPMYYDVIDNIASDGEVILRYRKGADEEYCRSRAFPTTFESLKAIACNKALAGAKMFESIWNPNKYDVMILFSRLPTRKWTISLYTTKDEVNCGEIARTHGGGGHARAAGWECEELPFEY